MSNAELIALLVQMRRDIDSEPFVYEQQWTEWTQARMEAVR